jgi:hypothetical protein
VSDLVVEAVPGKQLTARQLEKLLAGILDLYRSRLSSLSIDPEGCLDSESDQSLQEEVRRAHKERYRRWSTVSEATLDPEVEEQRILFCRWASRSLLATAWRRPGQEFYEAADCGLVSNFFVTSDEWRSIQLLARSLGVELRAETSH